MSTLLIATDESFIRVTRDGAGWAARRTLDGAVQCLAADSRDPRIVYAGSRGRGVHRSTDGGVTWDDTHLPHGDVFSLAVSGADGAVYAGTEPSRVFRSRDRGATWDELTALQDIPSKPAWSFPPRPWTHHVRWVAPSPHNADVLLVGIELGGLMYSGDGGETFLDHRPGAQRDVHSLAWHPTAPGRAYQAAGGGAAWSRDGGKTWTPADTGRDRHYCWSVVPHPADPETWFVSASPGPRQAHTDGDAHAVIYRWRGKDGPWHPLAGGLPQPLDAMPYALSFDPAGATLFAGQSDGRVFASRDGGDEWEVLRIAGDAPDRIAALAVVDDNNG